jgi:hypothetical protein
MTDFSINNDRLFFTWYNDKYGMSDWWGKSKEYSNKKIVASRNRLLKMDQEL